MPHTHDLGHVTGVSGKHHSPKGSTSILVASCFSRRTRTTQKEGRKEDLRPSPGIQKVRDCFCGRGLWTKGQNCLSV